MSRTRVLEGSPKRLRCRDLRAGADHSCSESLCKVNITGTLTKKVTNTTISWNITTHFNDGRVGHIPGIDDFYRWVNVFQNDTRTYGLQPGPAVMNQSFLLLGAWVPVVSGVVRTTTICTW